MYLLPVVRVVGWEVKLVLGVDGLEVLEVGNKGAKTPHATHEHALAVAGVIPLRLARGAVGDGVVVGVSTKSTCHKRYTKMRVKSKTKLNRPRTQDRNRANNDK